MITLKEVIIMDIKYLQENQQQLFQQMKDAGYATDYIYRFQVLVQYILDNNGVQSAKIRLNDYISTSVDSLSVLPDTPYRGYIASIAQILSM